MRLLPVLGALVLVAMMANASRPCDAGGLVWGILNVHGLTYVAFPAPVPTPGGNMASGAYVDDRGFSNIGFIECPTGLVCGDGTWLYLETNGEPGLQRGGFADLAVCDPLLDAGLCDHDFAACWTAQPDELVY
jgi:hypothetical protein